MEPKEFSNIFNKLTGDFQESNTLDLILEDYDVNPINKQHTVADEATQIQDIRPSAIGLDSEITITQQTKNGKLKSYNFVVCEVWLKPTNVFTIVNIKKEKVQKNFWILFYEGGTFYLKKGIKGPIGVHVTLTDPVENAMETE